MSYRVPFDVPVLSYKEALRGLHSSLKFGIQPLLETVEDMLAECGDPDLCYDCLQITGTNGKTSTSRYAAAILGGEGRSVALYTSPELVSYTERMEINGAPVDEERFAYGMAAAIEAGRRVNARRGAAGERPYDVTEFDLLTVAALVVFAKAGVDVAVLEVGMGGRWDATTAAKSIRAVAITGVGLDHTRILGDTLEAIAAEKAAIIKSGRSCVLGAGTSTPASVEQAFLDRCASEGVSPVLLRPQRLDDAQGEMHPGTPLSHKDMPSASYVVTDRPAALGASFKMDVATPYGTYVDVVARKPTYQAANIACAVVLCENYLGRVLAADSLCDSVLRCPTPGRFDVVRDEPVGIVDACHNPQSVQTFLTAVRAIAPHVAERPALLAAVLADKDVEGIVDLLAHEFPCVYVSQTNSPRALAAEELAEKFKDAGAKVAGIFCTVADALESLQEVPYIACGSITLAGEVMGLTGRAHYARS